MVRMKAPPYCAIFRLDELGWTNLKGKGYAFGYSGAVHKGTMPERPYRFVNELIAGRIAQFLLLPCPPFGFTHFTKQENVELRSATFFSSIDFDYEGTIRRCLITTHATPACPSCVQESWRSTFWWQTPIGRSIICGAIAGEAALGCSRSK